MEKLSQIIEELQDGITLYEVEIWKDIENILIKSSKDYYIIYKNLLEITCLSDILIYAIRYKDGHCSKKNKKFLLVSKKSIGKFDIIKKNDKNYYKIVRTLNKLYPDFNFFEI